MPKSSASSRGIAEVTLFPIAFIVVLLLQLLVNASAVTQRSSSSSSITFRSAPLLINNRRRGQCHRRSSSSRSSNSRTGTSHHSLFPLQSDDISQQAELCAAGTTTAFFKTLGRGALLRVASDLTGGTPLESIKCRVTATKGIGPIEAYTSIVHAEGGFGNLWAGTPSRIIEGALMGALFSVSATFVKKQMLVLGSTPTAAALMGGLVGGLAQAVVMTPAGLVFTSLNLNRGKKGFENDNAVTVTRRIIQEKGLAGMFSGGGPMAMRQATNWMSRSYFTEVARTTFKMSQYGVLGEIGSGVIGGLGSCWNTPIETIRVSVQADASAGRKPKTSAEYWNAIVEDEGYPGLFRGVTPRAVQAIWQTVFMVVVPNVLGV